MKYDETKVSTCLAALDGKQGASARQIAQAGVALTALLLEKNRAYGDSARQPIAVFAQGIDTRTRLGVRMDDKISRLMRGDNETFNEDAVVDLAGYLVLYLSLDDLESTP
jgi:hypothetical protein